MPRNMYLVCIGHIYIERINTHDCVDLLEGEGVHLNIKIESKISNIYIATVAYVASESPSQLVSKKYLFTKYA